MKTITIKLKDNEDKEHTYQITPFLCREGLQIMGRLSSLLKDKIPDELSIDCSDMKLLSILIEALANSASELFSDTGIKLIQDLLQGATRDNVEISKNENFDIAYCGNYGELFAVLANIIQTNFGGAVKDFFLLLQKKLGKNQKLKTILKSIK